MSPLARAMPNVVRRQSTGSGTSTTACAGKRVLMLLENDRYPQDSRVRREAQALVADGYHVSVICPADPRQASREVADGVHVYRFTAPPDGQSALGYAREYGQQ